MVFDGTAIRQRVTPACRRASARYGNPPSLGRMAAARSKAARRRSVAVFMASPGRVIGQAFASYTDSRFTE